MRHGSVSTKTFLVYLKYIVRQVSGRWFYRFRWLLEYHLDFFYQQQLRSISILSTISYNFTVFPFVTSLPSFSVFFNIKWCQGYFSDRNVYFCIIFTISINDRYILQVFRPEMSNIVTSVTLPLGVRRDKGRPFKTFLAEVVVVCTCKKWKWYKSKHLE